MSKNLPHQLVVRVALKAENTRLRVALREIVDDVVRVLGQQAPQ